MPTVLTHALLPVAAGIALGRSRVPPRLVAVGMAAAMLPDADVAMFALGIDYAHAFGHRGASHSLVFALACGLLAACFARILKAPPLTALLFVALSAASHPAAGHADRRGPGCRAFLALVRHPSFRALAGDRRVAVREPLLQRARRGGAAVGTALGVDAHTLAGRSGGVAPL